MLWGWESPLTTLNIPACCERIKPDNAPQDIGDLLRVLYAVAALNGSGLRLAAAKASVLALHERDYPDWICRWAIDAFAERRRKVTA